MPADLATRLRQCARSKMNAIVTPDEVRELIGEIASAQRATIERASAASELLTRFVELSEWATELENQIEAHTGSRPGRPIHLKVVKRDSA